MLDERKLRNLLSRVDDFRYSRGLVGLRENWKFNVLQRNVEKGLLTGIVVYGGKMYKVDFEKYRGRGGSLRATCSCPDFTVRKKPCKHIAFAAMWELGYRTKLRSEHKVLRNVV